MARRILSESEKREMGRLYDRGFPVADIAYKFDISEGSDAAIIYDDNTAEIIDHKTGKRYDGDYRPQMGLFAGGMMKKFSALTHVTTRLWYLDIGDEVIEEFTRPQALEILTTLEGNAKLMMNATRFPPQQSWKCRFCHFRNSNGGPCEY